MNEIYFYIYVFFTFLIATYLTLKSNSRHKFITFIITYWILAGTVLNTEYFIIDIKTLPFDLQPPRIIFILFSIYLILVWVGGYKPPPIHGKTPKFERYLYLYILLSIIVYTIHIGDVLSVKEFLASTTVLLTFLVIYLALKRTADKGMIKAFGRALLIVCVISSLIGIYQFLVDPLFFRLGSERAAFTGLLRSNGIFHAEYLQSYFLILGIIVALFTIRKNLPKYTLIGLFLLGIIFTFHRMSWIITALLFTLYFIKVKKKRILQMTAVAVFIGVILFSFLSIFFSTTEIKRNPFVQKRLLADTMRARIGYYTMVFKNIPKSWLIGFGSKKSDVYYSAMLKAGYGEQWARGEVGGIHNWYLAIMFFKGIPAFILYTAFIILAFYYFWKLAKFKHIFYFIMSFEVIKYIMLNMTNSFALGKDLGLLLAIFLGTGVAVYQKNIDVSGLITNE